MRLWDLWHYEIYGIMKLCFFLLGTNFQKSRGNKIEIQLWKLYCWSADLLVLKKKMFKSLKSLKKKKRKAFFVLFLQYMGPSSFSKIFFFSQTLTLCLMPLNGFGEKSLTSRWAPRASLSRPSWLHSLPPGTRVAMAVWTTAHHSSSHLERVGWTCHRASC